MSARVSSIAASLVALALVVAPAGAAKRDRAERSASRERAPAAEAAPPAKGPPPMPAAEGAQESEPVDAAPEAPRATVQSFGEGAARLHLVDHGDGLWSMHAESLGTYALFAMWKEAGGPEVIAKDPVDHPYTLSVHRVKAEDIVGRLLAGHGFTLHYDTGGRLAQVRVYSAEPGHVYRTPRLTESLGAWRDVETGADPTARTK